MVTGTSVTYISGTQGRPLPRREDVGVRRAHEPSKPKRTGLDWDAITPTCGGCGERSGQLGDGGLCPTCRGVQPTQPAEPAKAKKVSKRARSTKGETTYTELPEDELLRRFTGPDDTRLGRELAELEATDPDVAAAAEALDHATADLIDRTDNTAELPTEGKQGQPTTRSSAPRANQASSTTGRAPVARPSTTREKNPAAAQETRPAAAAGPEPVPNNVTELPTRYSDDANLDAQVAHAETILRASAGLDDPVARLLRLTAVSAIESLHLYLELHHRTPAPATCPRPAGAGHTSAEPNPPGLDGASRSAARSGGEACARPATGFQTFEKPKRRRASNTRGTVVDEQAIAREYAAGDTAPTIADRHGIRPKRVRDIVVRLGGQLRDDRKYRSGGQNRLEVTPELVETIRARYVDEQQSISTIAEQLGHGRHTITEILRDHAGVEIRPAAHLARVTVLTDEQRAAIVTAYLNGAGSADLAAEHHVRAETIRDIVRAAGHTIRPRGGTSHLDVAHRLAELGVTVAHVKAWAVEQGITDRVRTGRIPRAFVDAYEAAHLNNPTGDTTA